MGFYGVSYILSCDEVTFPEVHESQYMLLPFCAVEISIFDTQDIVGVYDYIYLVIIW